MTARTPPAVSDAAVEAYLIGASLPDGGRPDMTGHEYVEYIQRTYSTGDLIRAGLAAALPHLRSAAPSGETAPPGVTAEHLAQRFHAVYEALAPAYGYRTREESAKPWAEVPEHNRALMVATCAEVLASLPADAGVAAASVPAKPDPCGHTITGIGAQVLICTRPNGHDGAHADMYGAQWAERPTGTDAQTTPADPNSCRHCGVPQRSHGQRWVPDAGVHGWTEPTPEQRKQRMLARRRTNAQATPAIPVAAIRAELDAYRQAVDACHGSCSPFRINRAERLGGALADAVLAAAPSGEQPTAEPAGEV